MDKATLDLFSRSLERCSANPEFLDLFYQTFLASSPKVKAKFADTRFDSQKRALHGSFQLMLRAAREEGQGPPDFLDDLARRHGSGDLAIGGEFYDLWLDSLLTTVRACDPAHTQEIAKAWERVMGVGINHLCSRYHQ